MKHVHLVGIGGTGLSAIARVLVESGYQVSGSDRELSPLAQHLVAAGAQISIGHQAENIVGSDVVVCSSAVPDDNVEVQAARAAGIPVMKRSQFVGQILDDYSTIAVAGTHGKTTTSAMIAWLLTALDQDPSYILGGVSENLSTNARAGKGAWFVIEADEYDRMFLGLRPDMAVVTNVEHDHPDCFPTAQEFHQAFEDFVDCLTPDGVLLACGDDPGARDLARSKSLAEKPTFLYGLDHPSPLDYSGKNTNREAGGGYAFDAFYKGDFLTRISLQVPGKHNAQNALAAIAVAHRLSLPLDAAALALGEFKGTGRRFEVRGEAAGVVVVDDYAHHPTEIRATLAAAQARYPDRQLWVVWQPHTYSRTRLLFDRFTRAFDQADHVLVTEVYPARELAQPDFSARQVVNAMQHPDVHFIPDLVKATAFLLARLQPGSVLLVLSAGDADMISSRVLAGLPESEENHV
ncbi:MAG TPA: UDP-N-acetylmuramate--L-alanine ligase [Anaerolineales bacterium]